MVFAVAALLLLLERYRVSEAIHEPQEVTVDPFAVDVVEFVVWRDGDLLLSDLRFVVHDAEVTIDRG
jgi:hypothetical protein